MSAVQLPAFRGNIALLDVLHYLEPARQGPLLSTLAQCVPAEGMLFLRDCAARWHRSFLDHVCVRNFRPDDLVESPDASAFRDARSDHRPVR